VAINKLLQSPFSFPNPFSFALSYLERSPDGHPVDSGIRISTLSDYLDVWDLVTHCVAATGCTG
jgi:hypothetical protein